jgi:hypothetical protein
MRRLLLGAKHVFDSRGLTPQLTLLISIVSFQWFIFHCACLAGYRTGFFYFSTLLVYFQVLTQF